MSLRRSGAVRGGGRVTGVTSRHTCSGRTDRRVVCRDQCGARSAMLRPHVGIALPSQVRSARPACRSLSLCTASRRGKLLALRENRASWTLEHSLPSLGLGETSALPRTKCHSYSPNSSSVSPSRLPNSHKKNKPWGIVYEKQRRFDYFCIPKYLSFADHWLGELWY